MLWLEEAFIHLITTICAFDMVMPFNYLSCYLIWIRKKFDDIFFISSFRKGNIYCSSKIQNLNACHDCIYWFEYIICVIGHIFRINQREREMRRGGIPWIPGPRGQAPTPPSPGMTGTGTTPPPGTANRTIKSSPQSRCWQCLLCITQSPRHFTLPFLCSLPGVALI